MDVLVTAGGTPSPEDPLYPETRGRPKALVDVAGKPMLQWVLDALGGSRHVERIVIVGLDEEAGLACVKPMTILPNQGGLLANIEAGVRGVLAQNPTADRILAVSSDIPAITAACIDWAAERSLETDHDLYYAVIERAVMERRFPGARRTFVRLKDAEVCGSDMNVMRASLIENRALWERLIEARKSPAKQAALVGYDVLLLLLLRRLSLQAAERRISRGLRLRGRVVRSPYAEMGMDADKPHQLAILRQDLEAGQA
jgi:spore coat polysaccharide biosynthesis protein SpsF (cytidylyltransferase family)